MRKRILAWTLHSPAEPGWLDLESAKDSTDLRPAAKHRTEVSPDGVSISGNVQRIPLVFHPSYLDSVHRATHPDPFGLTNPQSLAIPDAEVGLSKCCS